MRFPSICKKSKTKASWKLSLFNHFKAISFIAKPKPLKHSNSVLSDRTARFISALDCSWSRSRSHCFTVPKDSGELLNMANEALRSNRLFFEPGNTGSILEAARFPFKDCVALALETGDPYMEFRVSMEEIVEACELKEQQHLEELLGWYLKMNRKKNHGFIVGAFIDMFAAVNS
ncbi:ovate family protein 13, ARABIDOPSIS THALIANA OVATE FAMILY PROTEIN 13 [Hibiscus trionum]|uniref:Transcription repressor n=1 Tax=Hibiscus trionum TaxID=183268 RepID=A0A9W7M5T4_HIBTR|nr:ovate family protein 13, ARABIDOPSIS THALIANA OVATE FAMILY PROTEIN 13 [Hibiscus trionum]